MVGRGTAQKERLARKREHFVNLYRKAWNSTAGLDSKRILSMSEKELDRSIDSLSSLSWVKSAGELRRRVSTVRLTIRQTSLK